MSSRGAFVVAALALAGCADPPAGAAEPLPPSPAALAAVAAAPEPAAAPPAPEPPSILLSAVGDCTLGSDYRSAYSPGSFHRAMDAWHDDYRAPFAGVLGALAADDVTLANLETTLTAAKRPVDAPFAFSGKPAYAKILKEGSVELVNFANNHAWDFGRVGHEETIASVTAEGVGVFGEGRVERRTVRGLELVSLGYTGGRASVGEKVARDVRAAKRPDNVVVVSFHWGVEGSPVPLPDQRALGRVAIDAGADLVLGHHPHVLQGVEVYGGRRIVYSLGNFVFGGHSHPEDMDSMIYQQRFRLRDGAIERDEPRLLPVRISSVTDHNDYRPVLLEGDEAARVLAKVERLSAALAAAPAPSARAAAPAARAR
jgi:poly-gamma-glutamate synthesis protein (capsule biosynthesis protein)